MRLKPVQVSEILRTIHLTYPGFVGSVFLYGSRVDDKKKGGDIDLCLIVKDEAEVAKLDLNRFKCQALLQLHLGGQKVDFSIISQATMLEDAFWKLALKNKIELL